MIGVGGPVGSGKTAVAAYALAGSEENARGHLVVTAPTGAGKSTHVRLAAAALAPSRSAQEHLRCPLQPGRAAVRGQHLPLQPGGLRGVGAPRPHAVGRRLPADARDRDGRAAGAHHLDQEGLDHLGAGDLRARRRPHRPGPGEHVRAPRLDDGARAGNRREGDLPGRRPAQVHVARAAAGHAARRCHARGGDAALPGVPGVRRQRHSRGPRARPGHVRGTGVRYHRPGRHHADARASPAARRRICRVRTRGAIATTSSAPSTRTGRSTDS